MSALNPAEIEQIVKDYLSQNSVLIVDTNGGSRMNLASSLSKMGADRQKMTMVSSLSEARYEIKQGKPRVIFTDYTFDGGSGFDLLKDQKDNYSESDLRQSLFVLITSNASQSSVARAAEEDVDTFIVKPYTHDLLKKTLASTIQTKMNPSEYMLIIERGKQELFKSNYDQAIDLFEDAMSKHERPTLACFYAGQAEFMKTAMNLAEKKYIRGLSYNKIHYKCLVGMYDLLMSQKKYKEAYDIIRRLAHYFPANPKRLTSVLRLTILTENFSHIEEYYQIFLNMIERTDDLVNSMCSALSVSGKYYLRSGEVEKALPLMEAAVVSGGGKTQFLAYNIETLVDFKIREKAEKYLHRLKKISLTNRDYWISKFLVSTLVDEPKVAIELGEKIIEDGNEAPAVYEKLIEVFVKTGDLSSSSKIFNVACQKWPEQVQDFKNALNSANIGVNAK